jgi:hypothetical protein
MEVITTIYNPPSGKKVLSVAYSTYAQLFMCLMNSTALCMYKLTKGGASKLVNVIHLGEIKDCTGERLRVRGLTAYCMVVSEIECVAFDSEHTKF